MSDGTSAFQRKLAEKRAKDAQAQEAPPVEKFDADLVPDDPYERSETDKEIDRIISRIDLVEAYRRYCGKMIPHVKPGQKEGIKISCPIPGHADEHPSAWINLAKQVWYCEPCRKGGDALDLAAYDKGYPVPDYKKGASFPKLRAEIARDYGLTITRLAGGVTIVTPPEETSTLAPEGRPDKTPTPAQTDPENEQNGHNDPAPLEPMAEPSENTDDKSADVIDMTFEEEIILPSLDWEKVVPHDTFLDFYMQAARIDDSPEEYHFWHAMIALGFALGRDVTLFDYTPVLGNLFVCQVGRSGTGKTKAKALLDILLKKALEYKDTDTFPKGTKKIKNTGSAEVLVKAFQKDVKDPDGIVFTQAPVRGLIEFNELSALTGRSSRMGSVIKPTMMEFYDGADSIGTSSLSTGIKIAFQPFASALTTTQPKALRNLLEMSDDDSGFLNRWVFACSRTKKKTAIGGVRADITPAVKPLQEIQGWSWTFKHGECMTWSEEAELMFTRFYHTRIEPDQRNSDTDLLVRMDLLMKKLILLFTANRKLKEVPIESVQDAINCYNYLVAAYKIVAGEVGNTVQNLIAERIIALSNRLKNGVTVREICNSLSSRKIPLYEIKRTIDTMTALGMLEVKSIKAMKGPATVRYSHVK